MSQKNVKVVRGMYDAFAKGDIPTVVAALDPQVEWWEAENFIYDDGNPYVGPDAGKPKAAPARRPRNSTSGSSRARQHRKALACISRAASKKSRSFFPRCSAEAGAARRDLQRTTGGALRQHALQQAEHEEPQRRR